MKFFLTIFTALSMNNIFGMSCDKEFEIPEKNTPSKQIGKPNIREGTLKEDTNYGAYGTFRAGTSSETINKAMKRVRVKFEGRFPDVW